MARISMLVLVETLVAVPLTLLDNAVIFAKSWTKQVKLSDPEIENECSYVTFGVFLSSPIQFLASDLSAMHGRDASETNKPSVA
ncbi:uncharacterized protein F4822DRAFT_426835 [Hypoxylon trugodes]|uniref:uncharacterized protein n=1 Tax=Hypoxylon trugodes TaxID=326681 RepID=UPI00219AC61B|nr:uncharacterized protein F4822DRAFT_426835 [Hypoxylon trugodes]KAI1390982.1 hypothetical protein F4822DRAFT_426835 [Hypoxylon trugodes]